MPESRLQLQIKKRLESLGCLVIKQEPPPVGLPDLLVVYAPGRHFWLEVKTPTGRVSPAQKAYHKWLEQRGEVVHVVKSVEDAEKISIDICRSAMDLPG